ncbi:MAG: 4-hydroxy-3-methylbut-2-enyl diphosphate reductase, partial [Myxococcaceae bacterium]|nr:4-hydroxy-3-methylbut-2-enyl diphosphate reductase [Myxococcaceae bacterium]
REVRELGFRDIEREQLVTFRIHGVTPAFIREMRELGYENISADDLVQLRIHGVDSKFVRALSRKKDGRSR